MNLEESAMDHMNKMATDILECPECESEEVFLWETEYLEETESEKQSWCCPDCATFFDIFT